MAGHAKEEADIYSIYYIIHIVYHIFLFVLPLRTTTSGLGMAGHA